MRNFSASAADDERMREFTLPLDNALKDLEAAFEWLLERAASDAAAAGSAAVDFLKLAGLTGVAHMWAAMAGIALDKVEGDNTGFYARKLTLARYYMQRLLPQTTSLLAAIRSGSELMMELEAEAF